MGVGRMPFIYLLKSLQIRLLIERVDSYQLAICKANFLFFSLISFVRGDIGIII